MDIDVVGGRDVPAASVRGSEIDIKVPESRRVFIEELFPESVQHESKDLELIEQENLARKEETRRRLLLRHVQNAYDINIIDENEDLKPVYKRYPNSTKLVFRFEEHMRYKIKNLHLIRQFKQLEKIEIFNGNNTNISVEFAKSPTCTHLEFDDSWFGDPPNTEFGNAIAKNEVLQSLTFKNIRGISPKFIRLILQSNSITELIFENSFLDPVVFEDILQSLNLQKLKAPREPLQHWNIYRNEVILDPNDRSGRFVPKFPIMPRILNADQWRQIDAHLLENTQRRIVFPILAAMQLTQSSDKMAIVDLLPTISRLLGDPPISRQRAVQMVEQIEPSIQLGKRKQIEPKALPFMFEQ